MLNARRVVAAVALAAVAGLVPVTANAADNPPKVKSGQDGNSQGNQNGNGPVTPTGWGWGG